MKLLFSLILTALLLSSCMVSVTATPVQPRANVSLSVHSARAPQRSDDCKSGGWRLVRRDGGVFMNQGDCVHYVQNGR